MFVVSVATKSGSLVDTVHWNEGICLVGKDKTSDIVLQGFRVGKQHATIIYRSNEIHVEAGPDAREISVNGKRHASYGPLNASDVIQIGDYVLRVAQKNKEHNGAPASNSRSSAAAVGRPPLAVAREQGDQTRPVAPAATKSSAPNNASPPAVAPSPVSPPVTDPAVIVDDLVKWRLKVHKSLLGLMDLRRVNVNQMEDEELRSTTAEMIDEAIRNMSDLPRSVDRVVLKRQVLAEAVGLGPLEELLADESISEIMVNAKDEIFYERDGQLSRSTVTFSDDQAVFSAIERIVSPIGRRIDESSPMVDGRLKDGSRVNAVVPPLALKGPCITIRKFMKSRLSASDLVRFGSVDDGMVKFLETAVLRKKNALISGGTGSGKTTLLNVLSNFIPSDERIVTIEDAAELKLYQSNLVSLEARPPNQEGRGQVSIRDLVKNCLRMRPDRIVVGECRGGEALDMLQAMNTGHDGSLTTVHANSPRDCLSRLEILVLMSGMDLPIRAIREQIASAVDVVVQQTRFSCGTRKVTSVTEVTGVEGDTIQTSEIFRFVQTGYDERGKVTGYFAPTGLIPEFYEDLRRRGLEVDLSIFETRD